MAHLQNVRAAAGHTIGAAAPTRGGALVGVDVVAIIALLDALVDVEVTADRVQAIARAVP